MQDLQGLGSVPSDFGPSVVTLGNFDGVHQGHRRVLESLVLQARSRGEKAVVVTFDPHPAVVHKPELEHSEIMPLTDKLEAFSRLGIDVVLVVEYTLDFARQSAEEFVRSVFVDALAASCVVVGHDARFGQGNEGDVESLRHLGERYGFDVVLVEDLEAHDGSAERRCSSTWIRSLLAEGDVERAAEIIGAPHRMHGKVVHGFARGRKLGFPTANLEQDASGLTPADGVYAGWLIDQQGQRWPTAISVGTNPTFEGVPQTTVEAHVINRPQEPIESFDLYGQEVSVEFLYRLRAMVAYQGVEALIEQMREDVRNARRLLEV